MTTIKTDAELLALAAKAAGIACDEHGPYVERQVWQQWFGEQGRFEVVRLPWQPFTDDGEALRLAVRLRLQITTGRLGCWIQGLSCPEDIKVDFTPGCDEIDIVRRAIVRAAAAIGEATP